MLAQHCKDLYFFPVMGRTADCLGPPVGRVVVLAFCWHHCQGLHSRFHFGCHTGFDRCLSVRGGPIQVSQRVSPGFTSVSLVFSTRRPFAGCRFLLRAMFMVLYTKHVGRTGRTTHPLFLMLWPFRRCPFLGGIFILFGCTLHRACHGLYIVSV